MAQANLAAAERYALVTGGNKGIGFETCKQLASAGITVVLTARDEKRGLGALEKLKGLFGLSDYVVFHQLRNENCSKINCNTCQTLEDAENCLQTNSYGAKRMTEALLPLLQLSDSPRIVNVSSFLGNLKLLSNEWAEGELTNGEILTEETIEKVVGKFLHDFKEGANDWPIHAATQGSWPKNTQDSASTAFVLVLLLQNLGPLTAVEGAASPVKLALLPDGGPSGLFFYRQEVFPF